MGFRQRNLSSIAPKRSFQKPQMPQQLHGIRNTGTKQCGQSVQRVIPAGSSAFHFNAAAPGIQCRKFHCAHTDQLFQQSSLYQIPVPIPAPFFSRSLFQKVILPQFSTRHTIAFFSGQYLRLRPVPGQFHLHQFLLPFRPDTQEVFNQIQAIAPMVCPISLSEVRICFYRSLRYAGHSLLSPIAQHILPRCHCLSTGALYQIRFDDQGVISVQLDQGIEVGNIFSAYERRKRYITSSVLPHVPEIPVSLGERLLCQGEVIVVPFQIPMLTAVQVKGMSSQAYRLAAAQEIIQIRPLAVLIKSGICRVACNWRTQCIHHCFRFRKLSCKPFGRYRLFQQFPAAAAGFSVPQQCINRFLLSRIQSEPRT